MIPNISCLIQACRDLGLRHESIDPHSSALIIHTHTPHEGLLFVNSTTPFNTHAVATLFKDKEFTFHAVKDLVQTPHTKGYFNPDTSTKWNTYKTFKNLEEIQQDIQASFTLPCIIKMNRGSHGTHVFIAETSQDILESLQTIFDKQSMHYDYVALAQEFIAASQELRIVIVNNTVELIYDKKLNSVLWQERNATYIPTSDPLYTRMQNFFNPLLEKLPIGWAGIDVLIDKEGNPWVIDINAAPFFDFFIEYNGNEKIVELYKKALGK